MTGLPSQEEDERTEGLAFTNNESPISNNGQQTSSKSTTNK